MQQPLLKLTDINKQFGSVYALKNAALCAYSGKVMGLVGENGAGKSTLMKIIAGVIKADSGDYYFNGAKVAPGTTQDSRELGITIIHQELSLVPHLSVAENIFLGKELQTKSGALDKKLMEERSVELLAKIGANSINVKQTANNYGVAEQQLIEIAKALTFNPKLMIMDEPTSSLAEKDVQNLFKLITELKQQGVAIIYISHRMEEIFTLCDHLTVLRDGQFITEQPTNALTEEQVIEYIVGRKLTERYPYINLPRGTELLRVENLSSPPLASISVNFYSGEVVGFYGLVGAGRTELAHSLYGLRPLQNGKLFWQNKPIVIKSIAKAIKQGIIYVSEDRKGNGLVLGMSVGNNMTLAVLDKLLNKLGQIKGDDAEKLGKHFHSKLKIKSQNLETTVKNLSGGNQQKVALARALIAGPRLLILDEPTRGIDIGAKREIYAIINELKQAGMAIMLISSDLSEVMGLSDRIVVMAQGKIKTELARSEATESVIMQQALHI